MRKILSFGLFLVIVSSPVFASEKFSLDENLSSVSFATIKKQYIVEPARIESLTGGLSESGYFDVTIDLKGVQTGVPIRDSRLADLFFDVVNYPKVKVSGKVNLKEFSNSPVKTVIPADVTLYGKTKKIDFPVTVFNSGDYIMASTNSPVVISGSDFGIPSDNLVKLAASVGGIEISDRVPLNFNLVFKM